MRDKTFISYCLLLVLLAGLALEYVVLPRWFGLPRDALLMGFAATPGTVVDGQVINPMGFTGDVVDGSEPAGAWRVLVLGSSTMFNRHMADHLKAALQQRSHRPVVLLDAGLRSHTTRADVIKLQWLLSHRWDTVLVYDGINDLWANHVQPADYRPDYGHLDPWYVRHPALAHSLVLRYGYNTAWHALRAVNRWTGERLFPDYQFVFPKKPHANAAGYAADQAFADNLTTIIEASRAHGAEPVLLTFAYHLPAHYSRQAFLAGELDYHNPDQYDARDVFNWGSPDYVRTGLERQNARVRALAAQYGVRLVDIDQAMSHRGEWFGDVCHFNATGVEVFAGQIASALLPAAPGSVPE